MIKTCRFLIDIFTGKDGICSPSDKNQLQRCNFSRKNETRYVLLLTSIESFEENN